MSKKPIRVCIIEDHAVVRAGLRMLIDNNDGMAVVGEAANRIEAFAAARKNPPDIFILDLDLNDENGLDFLPDLISTYTNAASSCSPAQPIRRPTTRRSKAARWVWY